MSQWQPAKHAEFYVRTKDYSLAWKIHTSQKNTEEWSGND
jgi:hypothetical protein